MPSRLLFLLLFLLAAAPALPAQERYFPPRGAWEQRTPAELGLDGAALDSARAFALRSESTAPRDQALSQQQSFGRREPMAEIIGPMQERGDPSGLVIYRGRVAAAWGPVDRVDMTHSVTKSFLSTVLGIAWRDGLIGDVNDTVARAMPPGIDLFVAPHNSAITWDHLLRQTSDWQGTLWDKPDWADRPEGPREGWQTRQLFDPGSRYKYNDVRVNALALAALQVLRRPLSAVLRDEVMHPIGASTTWRWEGYRNSWVELDGLRVQSVSGGGHWGGGMFINASDMARFGYLYLNRGRWDGQQIIPDEWITMASTPGSANADYGYMNWFLNTGRRMLPAAPESAVAFLGNGTNAIYIDWEHDLVVVVRWLGGGNRALNGVISRVLEALPKE
ncbi:MAG: serine hydrolase [Gemmatimonadales bacterium]|nr:serine hydrolase [Gemmatimonadales bacterium]